MTTDMQREALPIESLIAGLQRIFDAGPGYGVDVMHVAEWIEAAKAAQAELTELRAIVARLREPVSFKHAVKIWGLSEDSKSFIAALTAHNKHILGETE